MTLQPDWKTIESEVPGLVVRSVTPLGEGWTAKAYLVNDELVFKVPKRSDEWEELDREITFLALARPLLPVPVAEHLYQVRKSTGAPNGYAVYRCLRGDKLSLRDLSDASRSVVARTLASFLRALHDMIPSQEMRRILRQEDERAVSEQYYRDAQEKVAPSLTAAERRRLDDFFNRHLEDAGNFPMTPRIVHADLSAQHVLFAEGSVSGILDWGDVSLGDPDYDFSYLYEELGEAFVREVAFLYGHQDSDRLVRKAHYFSVVDQIGTILEGGDRALAGDEEAARRRLRALLHDGA